MLLRTSYERNDSLCVKVGKICLNTAASQRRDLGPKSLK